jgi:hypothetical protein
LHEEEQGEWAFRDLAGLDDRFYVFSGILVHPEMVLQFEVAESHVEDEFGFEHPVYVFGGLGDHSLHVWAEDIVGLDVALIGG